MYKQMLEKYAHLLVATGVNLQKGQILAITSPIECEEFVRMIAQAAFKEGAGDVAVMWTNALFARDRFLYAPESAMGEFPSWSREFYLNNLHRGAAFLSIHADDPEVLKDVNPERILQSQKARFAALRDYMESSMNNRHVWCVVSVPTAAWAKKVYPGVSGAQAMDKLWDAIFKAVRADSEDPVYSWKKHISSIKENVNLFNSSNFKYLHFKNSIGTDLMVELPEEHLWIGGSDQTPSGLEFVANMPTEEVFTLPKKTGVNGTAVASIPLSCNGNLVEKFSITFKDGRIVDYSAEKGYESLKTVIETDEGSHYLGEVALVPYDSPISNMKTLFYNALYDENASCHLAIGKAYPVCLKNGENLSKDELEKKGVNDSMLHVDFMIGTKDLNITGITADGRETIIFKDGNYAI